MALVYGDIAWASRTDGPGTRVVLYLRGCGLQCPWCHSPHLQEMGSDLLFFEERCSRCGACVAACPHGVHRIDGGRHHVDRSRCRRCGRCVAVCPTVTPGVPLSGALALPVLKAAPEDLFRRLRPQLELLRRIGGLTVCGGEPLVQARALRRLLELCRARGIHVAVETSGAVSRRRFALLVDVVDCWLYGLRPMGEEVCDPLAVGDFDRVRRNLAFLAGRPGTRVIVRTPVVPGTTDGRESLSTIADVMVANGLSELELLPLNPHSSHYYRAMGRPYPLGDVVPPSDTELSQVSAYFGSRGLQARIVQ